jgi:hypothetical protein
LLDEGGRHVIEEMGVVHEEDEPPAARRLHEDVGATAEKLRAVVDPERLPLVQACEVRGEDPEREVGGGPGGGDADDGGVGRVHLAQQLQREPCLPDARRPGQHQRRLAAPEQRLHPPELAGAADERPIVPHQRRSPHGPNLRAPRLRWAPWVAVRPPLREASCLSRT